MFQDKNAILVLMNLSCKNFISSCRCLQEKTKPRRAENGFLFKVHSYIWDTILPSARKKECSQAHQKVAFRSQPKSNECYMCKANAHKLCVAVLRRAVFIMVLLTWASSTGKLHQTTPTYLSFSCSLPLSLPLFIRASSSSNDVDSFVNFSKTCNRRLYRHDMINLKNQYIIRTSVNSNSISQWDFFSFPESHTVQFNHQRAQQCTEPGTKPHLK